MGPSYTVSSSPYPGAEKMIDRAAGKPYHVVEVHFVTRVTNQPLFSSLQRARQARHLALLLLQAGWGIQPANVAVLIGGSSFGGIVAQVGVLYYPQEFHAGVSAAFGASLRTVIHDHDSLTFLTSLQGVGSSGYSYRYRSAIGPSSRSRKAPTSPACRSSTGCATATCSARSSCSPRTKTW